MSGDRKLILGPDGSTTIKKFFVLLSQAHVQIESDKSFDEVYLDLKNQAEQGLMEFNLGDGIKTYFKVSPNAHFTFSLLNEKQYSKMQSEQKYAAMMAGQVGRG